MAKGKFQGTTTATAAVPDKWSPLQLMALRVPFPAELDAHFRAESDAEADFMAAYGRAVSFTVKLGDTRVAYLWQQALKIGFRAGRGSSSEALSAHERSEHFGRGHEVGLKEGRTGGLRDGKQDGRKAGKLQGLKEGELIGFEKGLTEGLSEGKRLGFVAGRDFGEKRAAKLSKPPIPDRVLVDVGTDSPVDAASLLHPSSTPAVASPSTAIARTTVASAAPSPALSWASLRIYAPDLSPPIHASTQTKALSDTAPPSIAPSAPFIWSDEACTTPAHMASPLPPPVPRDFSILCSASTPLTPFSTLQRRSHRKKKSARLPCRSASCSAPSRFPPASAPAYRPRSASATATLDWDHDPRLTDLSRALRSLGWDRGGGGGGV
ncbi:hypothetical protein C8R47DRAFT_1227242 [Mycena vitilis]|nr:hypothetical protein C8R47DRAFT_1227242 [Mycena vitilis]